MFSCFGKRTTAADTKNRGLRSAEINTTTEREKERRKLKKRRGQRQKWGVETAKAGKKDFP